MASKRKHCPHCDDEVIVKVYKQHRKRYYNEISDTWTTLDDIDREEEELLFSDKRFKILSGNDVDSVSFTDDQHGLTSEENMDIEGIHENIQHGEELLQNFIKDLEEEDRVYFCEPGTDEERDFVSGHCEIWDTVDEDDINEDFKEHLNSSDLFVSVSAAESHDPRLLTLANLFCLFLSYLWYFHNVTDACMMLILGFFKTLFHVLGAIFPCISAFSILLPVSLYKLKKSMGLHEDRFIKYVVCPKCCSVYKFNDCYKRVGNKNVPVKCKFIEFPAHKQKKFRQPCGAPLLKEVELQGNKKRLYPFKVYCYKSVLQSLSDLVKREGFVEKCELWRDRRPTPGVLSDIYDGRIWREFQTVNGRSFLNFPQNYAFQLNLDWFCHSNIFRIV
ncbi:uncharacterized protein [Ptychodera flava]|uniref:uncharacterized protein n=1 Tax=Ptychodera flava TaxID=63121 RepID=UPI00396A9A7D